MRPEALPWTHALLAIAVMAVWGTNFVFIRVALDHLPPLTFAALRFFLACAPAIFFIRRPPVPWRNLAAYGVLIGAGQFGLLFIAMHGHISPGLASLVVQTQVFFTVALSMRLTGEKVRAFQIVALALAGAGLAVLPAFLADRDPVLTRVLPQEGQFTRTFWMSMPSESKHLARMQVTWAFLRETVAAQQDLLKPKAVR